MLQADTAAVYLTALTEKPSMTAICSRLTAAPFKNKRNKQQQGEVLDAIFPRNEKDA